MQAMQAKQAQQAKQAKQAKIGTEWAQDRARSLKNDPGSLKKRKKSTG